MRELLLRAAESSAVWAVLVTIAVFAAGTAINRITKKTLCNPLLLGTIFMIVFLRLTGISYPVYKAGASGLSALLLPATVSLAVPLYEKRMLLKKYWAAIAGGLLSGVLTSFVSIGLLALLFRLDHSQYATLLPKSVTTAIGMDVSAELGGISTLTGAVIILTGIVGNMMAEWVYKVLRIRNPIAKGIGIGTSSHAIGTAKALQMGETEGAMSGLAIAAAGVLTAVLAPFAAGLL